MTRLVEINCDLIADWASFHDTFAQELRFPPYYGRNMNAWIDCMSHLDEPDSGMTAFHIGPGETLKLCLRRGAGLLQRCPEIYNELIECAAFVNLRAIDKLPKGALIAFVLQD